MDSVHCSKVYYREHKQSELACHFFKAELAPAGRVYFCLRKEEALTLQLEEHSKLRFNRKTEF